MRVGVHQAISGGPSRERDATKLQGAMAGAHRGAEQRGQSKDGNSFSWMPPGAAPGSPAVTARDSSNFLLQGTRWARDGRGRVGPRGLTRALAHLQRAASRTRASSPPRRDSGAPAQGRWGPLQARRRLPSFRFDGEKARLEAPEHARPSSSGNECREGASAQALDPGPRAEARGVLAARLLRGNAETRCWNVYWNAKDVTSIRTLGARTRAPPCSSGKHAGPTASTVARPPPGGRSRCLC